MVFIDGKFVQLTEYGDVVWRRRAPVRILCNHGTTKQFNSKNRFRVAFGVGHIFNTIEH